MQAVWPTMLLEEIRLSSRFTVLHHSGSLKRQYVLDDQICTIILWQLKNPKVSGADRPNPCQTVNWIRM